MRLPLPWRRGCLPALSPLGTGTGVRAVCAPGVPWLLSPWALPWVLGAPGLCWEAARPGLCLKRGAVSSKPSPSLISKRRGAEIKGERHRLRSEQPAR